MSDFVRILYHFKGHSSIMERYGQMIMEKVSCLKDLSCNFLQKLVGVSYSFDGVPYSGLMSSFVILRDKLILCDRGTTIHSEQTSLFV